ncbi:MAG TPA: 30S ribosomal protein S2, partial [Thermodesulfobacteriota bacterium]|nr:30S ribosomal protein S2 [Thermodesulfobacteriota bacterium]
KKQAQTTIEEEAKKCGMFYVNQRWLGGMLTNFTTVKKGIDRLNSLEAMKVEGKMEAITKKEALLLERERIKLDRYMGGIKDMNKLPGAIFVIDVKKEAIAVKEANKLGIPVVAVVDTNCSPDNVDYIIPGNDDAIRAIQLFVSSAAATCLEGRQIYEEGLQAATDKEQEVVKPAPIEAEAS